MTTDFLLAISPQLELKISPRARRIALRLDTARRVMNLVVPQRFSMRKAEQFALEHRAWINAKLAELPPPVPFCHGQNIPVFGQNRVINVRHDPSMRSTSISLETGRLCVSTNQQDPSLRIARFLKREARATLGNLAREKASMIDRPIAAIQIRDTKSRWGSCGPDGRISFSWRLIFAPWEAMDYVVAHEVAHLIHMNHGKRFWGLCEKLCDDYDVGKNWMRANGNELTRYG